MTDLNETPVEKAEHALEDADQLCADLKAQIARAREMVREARDTLEPRLRSDSKLA